MTPRPFVRVVDDDPAVRDSLCLLLEAEGIAARPFDSAEALLADVGGAGGCILADIRMPGIDGLALLDALAARRIELPVVMMTGHADVPMAVSAMKKGAADFIQKPIDPERLLAAMRQALAAAVAESTSDADLQERFARLTEREREVFALLVAGDPNKVVAFKLAISPRTVEIHRARIMEKLDLRNVAELVRAGLALKGIAP